MTLRRINLKGNSTIDSGLVRLGAILVQQDKFVEAEPLLRECLDIRQEELPKRHRLIPYAMSILGASLAGQRKFAEAEPLLLNGFTGMAGAPDTSETRKRKALERLVKLYESWHAVEPDAGYDGMAVEWRAKPPQDTLPQPASHP